LQYLCRQEFFFHEPSRALIDDLLMLTHEPGAHCGAAAGKPWLAVKTGAMKPRNTRRVMVDTTVQPKNAIFPTDSEPINRARVKLIKRVNRSLCKLKIYLAARHSIPRARSPARTICQIFSGARCTRPAEFRNKNANLKTPGASVYSPDRCDSRNHRGACDSRSPCAACVE